MVCALYAVIAALLLVRLSFTVARLRMQYRVFYGDGGFSELQNAIQLKASAREYIPTGLVLLLLMEMNGADTWMIHVCGILLISSRLLYCYAYHHCLYRLARSGMMATWIAILLMALANMWFMPWELVFSFH